MVYDLLVRGYLYTAVYTPQYYCPFARPPPPVQLSFTIAAHLSCLALCERP